MHEEARAWLIELDRVGRLVAAGSLTDPAGHLLILRASSRAEAERVLRFDPFRDPEEDRTELIEWAPKSSGAGVALEPAPPRGAGRLTVLHRISVFVRDRARALEWYREVLGLEVRSEDAETGYVELSLGPGAAGLALVRPGPEWGEPAYSEGLSRIGRPTGIVFQTDSVDALALRLKHAKAQITQAPHPEPWGGRSLRFTDPDGNEYLALDGGPPSVHAVPRPARRRHRRRPDVGEPTAL